MGFILSVIFFTLVSMLISHLIKKSKDKIQSNIDAKNINQSLTQRVQILNTNYSIEIPSSLKSHIFNEVERYNSKNMNFYVEVGDIGSIENQSDLDIFIRSLTGEDDVFKHYTTHQLTINGFSTQLIILESDIPLEFNKTNKSKITIAIYDCKETRYYVLVATSRDERFSEHAMNIINSFNTINL